ncbi:MAG: hypothetical protein LUH45_02480, partial [Clostridiales bacterium]|nr:hypothetical protein [Clostridiales bacterium]
TNTFPFPSFTSLTNEHSLSKQIILRRDAVGRKTRLDAKLTEDLQRNSPPLLLFPQNQVYF